MPYSAHRPGRFDSQGRIIIDGDSNADTDDLDFLRDFAPTGADDAPQETVVSEPSAATPERLPQAQGDGQPDAADPRPAKARVPRPPRVRTPRRPRTPGSRARTLAILGGAEGEILDRVPNETPRFVQMFFVLAGTALVSAISMLFALTTGVQAAVWLAVPLALVWALIIFNLDRFLTSTMASTKNVWRLIGLAIPRVIMAAIIGFVVAEPLVLQIFNNDIAREVASTNITQSQSDQEALESGPEKIALDAASERVAALENQAATGIVAGTDASSATESAAQATVDDLTAKMTAQQGVIDQARILYQCELTGEGAGTVPGCTGVNGEGASSEAAQAQLAQAQQTYDALGAQLRTANEELAAAGTAAQENTSTSEAQNREQAQSQLEGARTTYDQALAAYNARADAVAQGNAGAIGLLSQISGLNRLSEREPTILWAHILIAALFFMIELLPVLVKVLTSYGDPSLYEKASAIRKQVDLDRVTAEGFRDRAAIVTAQSQAVDEQTDAGSGEPQTRAERREVAESQERERAEKRAQAQTLAEQEDLVRPTVG